ncbi:hypothetical protein [Sorangium cellulosum]|uniref:Uncharacterized protein n=1 Tax=Sorangium cellulosum TaxID=56 RepID=A0A150QZA9_SORCE|nr:hypothetical protein [Sorangium cellulosum]KYF73339.1 hypothetical protein BE15_01440 [Sorangium cellulosum]
MRSREVGLLGLGALCAVAVFLGAGGCQPEGNTRPPGWSGRPGGTIGEGGSGAETASSGDGGREGEGAAGTAATGSAGGDGVGTGDPPVARVATIEEITTGVVGEGVDVEAKGVVAMSRKWLVSKSKSSGSCLWGVFLSAPGIPVTEANSGILALSYGTRGVTDDQGNVTCPNIEQASAGDAFPDDVKPGDVLDVTGRTSYYSPADCDEQPPEANPTRVKQRQLASVTKVKLVGSAPIPEPHVFSGEDIAKLAAPSDPDGEKFHDAWGGVKVRVAGPLSPTLQGEMQTVVGAYGNIVLAGSGLRVGDKFYYVQGSMDACHGAPDYPSTDVEWARIDGFSTLDYCTWSLQPLNKCADFDPAGKDCTDGLLCE